MLRHPFHPVSHFENRFEADLRHLAIFVRKSSKILLRFGRNPATAADQVRDRLCLNFHLSMGQAPSICPIIAFSGAKMTAKDMTEFVSKCGVLCG